MHYSEENEEIEGLYSQSFFRLDLEKFGRDNEIRRRVYIVHFTLAMGFVLLITLGTLALVEQNTPLAFTDYCLAVILIGILVNFHVNRCLEFTITIMAVLTGTFFAWLLIYGGVENTAFVWYYTYPLYAVFCLGPKKGAAVSAALGASAVLFFISDNYFPGFAQYDFDFKVRFIPSYFVVVIFAYLAESFRDNAQKNLRAAYETLEQKVEDRTAELSAKNIALEVASSTDALTGLINRMKLDEILHYEINLSKRYEYSFCIILVDLDHFKKINDTYGHIAGDEVLIAFASLLKENLRATDTIGRWGGEEFLIICPSTERESCMLAAEKLREKVAESSFPIVENLTASFGVTCYRGGDNVNSIVKRADEALYRAKETRNACSMCTGQI